MSVSERLAIVKWACAIECALTDKMFSFDVPKEGDFLYGTPAARLIREEIVRRYETIDREPTNRETLTALDALRMGDFFATRWLLKDRVVYGLSCMACLMQQERGGSIEGLCAIGEMPPAMTAEDVYERARMMMAIVPADVDAPVASFESMSLSS